MAKTYTYRPNGHTHSEGRGTRPVHYYAKTRGLDAIYIHSALPETKYAAIACVVYSDDYYTIVPFHDYDLCATYFMKRWPKQTVIVPVAKRADKLIGKCLLPVD